MSYQSISINSHHDDVNPRSVQTTSRKYRCIALVATGTLLYITSDWLRLRLFNRSETSKLKPPDGASIKTPPKEDILEVVEVVEFVPIPTGVNLGGWLSLEDWFYVGANGAVEVATPDDAVAASCLPPLHLDQSTGPRWNSETDLLEGLGE